MFATGFVVKVLPHVEWKGLTLTLLTPLFKVDVGMGRNPDVAAVITAKPAEALSANKFFAQYPFSRRINWCRWHE